MKADNGYARTQRTELGNNMVSGEHGVTEECNVWSPEHKTKAVLLFIRLKFLVFAPPVRAFVFRI